MPVAVIEPAAIDDVYAPGFVVKIWNQAKPRWIDSVAPVPCSPGTTQPEI